MWFVKYFTCKFYIQQFVIKKPYEMNHLSKVFKDPKSPLKPITPLTACNDHFGPNNFGSHSSIDSDATREEPPSMPSPCVKIKLHLAVEVDPRRFSKKFKKLRNVFEKGQSCMPRSPLKVLHRVCRSVSPQYRDHCSSMSSGDWGKLGNDGRYTKAFEYEYEYATTPKTHKRPSKEGPPVTSSESVKNQTSPLQKFLEQEALSQNCAKNRFRQGSPVAPKALDKRVASLLKKSGLTKYCGFFQQEEIDMPVFRMLTRDCLSKLGISKAKDLEKLLRAIEYAKKIY